MDEIGNNFKKTEVEFLDENVFRLIGDDWMLITAGSQDTNQF